MHVVAFSSIVSWTVAKSTGHCTSAVMDKFSAESGRHLRVNNKTVHAVAATIHQRDGPANDERRPGHYEPTTGAKDDHDRPQAISKQAD